MWESPKDTGSWQVPRRRAYESRERFFVRLNGGLYRQRMDRGRNGWAGAMPYPGPVIPGSRRPLCYQPPPTFSLHPIPAVRATCRHHASLALGDFDAAIVFYPDASGCEGTFEEA